MSDERNSMDELEREVEAGLAELGSLLNVPPAPAAVERVKSAVRCEVDEFWLAGQPTPEPAPPVLARVRSAVRQELALSDRSALRSPAAGRYGPRSWAWPQGVASLAAAAMVAVCVGVIRQAGMSRPDATDPIAPSARAVDERVELFVQAADEALTGDAFTNSILNELGAIEYRMSGWHTTSSDSERGLMEFERTLDELLQDPDTSEGPVGLGGRREDALG